MSSGNRECWATVAPLDLRVVTEKEVQGLNLFGDLAKRTFVAEVTLASQMDAVRLSTLLDVVVLIPECCVAVSKMHQQS